MGILGGGQLGAMLMRSAIDLGLRVSVLDKHADVPCARYTNNFIKGDLRNYEDVLAFGRTVDVLTIEIEAVNVHALRQLEQEGIEVHPSSSVIEIISNKWTQKNALQAAGLPVVPGVYIGKKEELYGYTDRLPGCLKSCSEGYDGRGVMMLRSEQDIEAAFEGPCVLEDLVDIKQELSVIVTRNAHGAVTCFDPVSMFFNKEKFVLDYQLCPAEIDPALAAAARDMAVRAATALNMVGILAVEMFVDGSGKLLINELAPRPHNSGHHTMEACATSQYGQHLRAILGLPLGSTELHSSSVMVNLLEPEAKFRDDREQAMITMLGIPDVHLHWYGKTGGMAGRKMGHVTITGQDRETVLQKAETVRNLLKHGQ